MKTQRLVFILFAMVCVLVFVLGVFRPVSATQVVLVPNAGELRFQLIGNEPIAGPDGRALVKDWAALMFKDRKTGECYLVFSRGSGMSAASVATCRQ
jgi:hypothetical protein